MVPENIKRILIANRGEIAVRIIRTCREMDIEPVALYSDIDRTALHVKLADEAYPLKGTRPADSYLHQEKILSIARQAHVDAIHPGYGFLSENPSFAENVRKAGIAFIGPPTNAIRLLGDKTQARLLAAENNIPMVPGFQDTLINDKHAADIVRKVGYPVLLKAAAGGGGKGMRIVRSESELSEAFRLAQSEALTAFGDNRIYVERYLEKPHHIEIQILGDHHGGMVSLGERDCSIQRRHQKVIEESPSTILDETLRRSMGEAAIRLATAAGYTNAGTVEFLVDEHNNFYFLEVNTRLQVEHPVTELVTGLDLVRLQILVTQGDPLPFRQNDITPRGHAIECRVYAEDPGNGFLPSTGRLRRFSPPGGPRVRVENGVSEGDDIPIHYDPLLAKVLTWGASREESIMTMLRALSEFHVEGIRTTIPFCSFVLSDSGFREGLYNTGFVDDRFQESEFDKGSSFLDFYPLALGAALLAANAETSAFRNYGHEYFNSTWKKSRSDTFRS